MGVDVDSVQRLLEALKSIECVVSVVDKKVDQNVRWSMFALSFHYPFSSSFVRSIARSKSAITSACVRPGASFHVAMCMLAASPSLLCARW
jgi:hypothetical protein